MKCFDKKLHRITRHTPAGHPPNPCRAHCALRCQPRRKKSPDDFSSGLDSFLVLGSSTWARTRDLRINSLQIEAYARFYPILGTS